MSFRRHLRRPQLPDSRRRLIHHPHPDQGQLGVDALPAKYDRSDWLPRWLC